MKFLVVESQLTKLQHLGPLQENRTRAYLLEVSLGAKRRLVLVSPMKLIDSSETLCVSTHFDSYYFKKECTPKKTHSTKEPPNFEKETVSSC